MYTAYKNLFYKIYVWNKEFLPKSEQPVLNAFLAVSLLGYINIINISLLFELILKIKILDFNNINPEYWIAIIIGILFLNYLIFLNKGRYAKIIKSNKNLYGDKKSKGAILFCILSVLFLVFLIFYFLIINSTSEMEKI